MAAPLSCRRCGSERPTGIEGLAWTLESDGKGETGWLCRDCAREHIRSIEAKLDDEYW